MAADQLHVGQSRGGDVRGPTAETGMAGRQSARREIANRTGSRSNESSSFDLPPRRAVTGFRAFRFRRARPTHT